ncbi:MAG: 3-deoxy-D-manno-octulosonic acid transferase [Phycisphaerae bacterium]
MTWLLNLAYIPAAIACLPLLLYQIIVQKKNRHGWRDRFGFIRRRAARKPCIWIHAVSLGEVNATRSLVAEIERRLPAYDIVISATTDTGYAAARRHYPAKLVFRYPLDFSCAVRRVLDRVRPDAIVLMELEVWPNLVELTRRRGIPIGIANGRVTKDKSMRRFRRPLIRTVARRMFSEIAWVAAQNERYAARFIELGARPDRTTVSGTMKYDTAIIADAVLGQEALAQALHIDRSRPLIAAGSTGPGEEEMLLDACDALRRNRPDIQLAIVPRKPERFDEVAQRIRARGFACNRRSQSPDLLGHEARAEHRKRRVAESRSRRRPGTDENAITPIFLGDTMGELRKFYALADVVFVGRSLAPMGGSDVMEVAGLGRPMCFGPHMENFSDVVAKLSAANAAVQIRSTDELAETLDRLLSDPDGALAMGRRAQDVVRQNVGATEKTVALLCESLGRRSDYPTTSISTLKIA